MFFVSPAIAVLLLFCCVVLIIARFDEKRADDHQNLFVELNSPLFLSHPLSLFLSLSHSLSLPLLTFCLMKLPLSISGAEIAPAG